MDSQSGNRSPFHIARLTEDPDLRAELVTARSWSVPHSELLGRIPSPGEPRWTDRDRGLALALTAYEKGLHDCGQPVAEAFNPANEDAYTAEGIRCFACAAAAKESRAFDGDRDGLSITIEKSSE